MNRPRTVEIACSTKNLFAEGFIMQAINAWDIFFKSGRVEDYLNYCQQRYTYSKKEQSDGEIFDRRSCDKRE